MYGTMTVSYLDHYVLKLLIHVYLAVSPDVLVVKHAAIVIVCYSDNTQKQKNSKRLSLSCIILNSN